MLLKSMMKPALRETPQRECNQVYRCIKRWKAHDGAVLLPVVGSSTVPMLKEKAKPRWWKLNKSSKSIMCITTPQALQQDVDNTTSQDKVHELFFLVSRQVDLRQLQFRVPSTVDNLYIILCGPSTRDAGVSDRLILNGASTFCDVRLDEWQAKRVGKHNLILGHGVAIQLSMGIPWTARDAWAAISKQQREEVCKHFRDMCEAKYQDSPQWNKWRGPVSKLLDVAAGTATFQQAVDCYAEGIVVQAAAKLTRSGIEGAIKISAGLLCLSGPGKIALAGAGIAAAIYFVPWDTVWAWFRNAFGMLLTWIMRAWENLKVWVQSAVAEQGPKLVKQAISEHGPGLIKQAMDMRVKPVT